MKVLIQINGPGGELDSVTLDNIDNETDERISEAVAYMALAETWAIGDTLSITEVQ